MDVLEAKVQRGPELLDRGLGPEHAAGQGEDLLGNPSAGGESARSS